MDKEIDINKFNKSITFKNRGIGFTQIGISGEILDLIDDLQQQCKRQKEIINKAIEYIKSHKTDYSPYELSDYNVRKILEILEDGKNE